MNSEGESTWTDLDLDTTPRLRTVNLAESLRLAYDTGALRGKDLKRVTIAARPR